MFNEPSVFSFAKKIVSAVTIANLVAVELQSKVTNLQKIGFSIKKQALTQADLACQEIILKYALEFCPDANLYAEENTNLTKRFSNQTSEWTIVVDPIDGTLRYFEGSASFGIQVALIYKDIYVAAIVGFPKKNIVLSAIKGKGVFMHSGSSIRIDKIPECQKVIFCHDEVPPSEIQKIHSLGFKTSMRCGTEITTAPVLGNAIAGIRPENVSLFGRIGAMITIEAGGFCCDNKGQQIEQITSTPMSSLIVSDCRKTAELIVNYLKK